MIGTKFVVWLQLLSSDDRQILFQVCWKNPRSRLDQLSELMVSVEEGDRSLFSFSMMTPASINSHIKR